MNGGTMNKKIVIIIAAAVVVLVAVGAIVALNMNNKTSQPTSSSNNASKQTESIDTSKTFSPQDITKLPYVSTSTTTVSGQTVTSTTESDGKGTTKTSSTVSGMTTESYVTGNTVITCVNGACSKTTAEANPSTNQAVTNTSQYRDTAKNTGSETIDGKTYQVWKATGQAGDVTYYIDSENRIGRMSLASGTTVVYDYKDVSITIPQV